MGIKTHTDTDTHTDTTKGNSIEEQNSQKEKGKWLVSLRQPTQARKKSAIKELLRWELLIGPSTLEAPSQPNIVDISLLLAL